MGNCHAAAAAATAATAATAAPATEIEHPDGKRERIYCPISAVHVMSSNPGYYVAVVTSSGVGGGGGEETAAEHVSLLQPDDNLQTGHAYRLVSFEEVLREFGSKKRVRLNRLIRRREERDERKMRDGGADEAGNSSPEMIVGPSIICNGGRTNNCVWKPTLHSIAEIGI